MRTNIGSNGAAFSYYSVHYPTADAIRTASIHKNNGTGTALSAQVVSPVASDVVVSGFAFVSTGSPVTGAGANGTLDYEFAASSGSSAAYVSELGASGGLVDPTITNSVAWAGVAFACSVKP